MSTGNSKKAVGFLMKLAKTYTSFLCIFAITKRNVIFYNMYLFKYGYKYTN